LIPKGWNSAHTRAEESFRFSTDLWTEAQKRVEARRNRGDKRTSLMDEMLDDITQLDVAFEGTKLPNFLGALMQGAADTGALAMRTNIMFLATHPRVQDKAQKELDALCGADRMPTWADFKNLPYINCIMKEGLRIRPV
jgi:cytochrome P450